MSDQPPTGLPEPADTPAAAPLVAPGIWPADESQPPSVEMTAPSSPSEPPEPATGPAPLAGAAARAVPRVLGYLAAAAGGLLVGALLVAAGGFAAGTPRPGPTPPPTAVPSEPPAWADGQVVGRPDAPVTIEIWADYQCPFCRLETFAFGGALEREYAGSGTARIVYRDYAFLGQESVDAAVAARCAGRQAPGAYWRYHDLLFVSQQGENQGTFARQNLVALAGVANLDVVAFTACLDDPAVREAVTAETTEGGALGVGSTPTTRVSGPGGTQVLQGFSRQWSVLAEAIEKAAKPAPSPEPGGSPAASPGASPAAPGGPSPTASPGASSTPAP